MCRRIVLFGWILGRWVVLDQTSFGNLNEFSAQGLYFTWVIAAPSFLFPYKTFFSKWDLCSQTGAVGALLEAPIGQSCVARCC